MGTPGWIHTAYDNSTSTETFSWIEPEDLEAHIKVAALTIMRVSPDTSFLINVALLSITSSKTIVGQGYTMQINVTVANQGDYTETFSVTLYANTTTIETRQITLTNLNFTTITFSWNTSGFVKGNYTIWAHAEPLLGETDIDDNTLTDGLVRVTIPGDVAEPFGFVDMTDIGWICLAYASTPAHPQWNPNMDINNDNIVDMTDIGYACLNYAKTDP